MLSVSVRVLSEQVREPETFMGADSVPQVWTYPEADALLPNTSPQHSSGLDESEEVAAYAPLMLQAVTQPAKVVKLLLMVLKYPTKPPR